MERGDRFRRRRPALIMGCFAEDQTVSEELCRWQASEVRIGAVRYLNAWPLTFCLPRLCRPPASSPICPAGWPTDWWPGDFDVALVPSIEYLRNPGCTIVSDACIASDGPVRSIRLYSRLPLERIGSLALDEGSRTSAALVRIWLKERFGLTPALEPLAIGAGAGDCAADAVMLIGDRGMRPVDGQFEFAWDLGEEWTRWTGLPFVFAMWVARPGAEWPRAAAALGAARDEGVTRLPEIARQAAPVVGIPEARVPVVPARSPGVPPGGPAAAGARFVFSIGRPARAGVVPAERGTGIVFHHRNVAG